MAVYTQKEDYRFHRGITHMKVLRKRKVSLIVSSVAIFAAIHTILGLIPGIWRSQMILIEPLEGVVLGPKGGFLSALIGGLLARFIRPRVPVMYLFGLGEPVGALVAGLTYKGAILPVVSIYTLMLLAYFLHPLGRILPAWCLWDIYIAYAVSLIYLIFSHRLGRRRELRLLIAALLGIEADVLTRIFLLIPVELYRVLGLSERVLTILWIAGAFETPIETAISVFTTLVIGIPLLSILDKIESLEYPLT